jgi:hypothetical protein
MSTDNSSARICLYVVAWNLRESLVPQRSTRGSGPPFDGTTTRGRERETMNSIL